MCPLGFSLGLVQLYRQIVGIPMGSNCAPLIAELFSFCHKRDFMASFFIIKKLVSFKHLSQHLDMYTSFSNSGSFARSITPWSNLYGCPNQRLLSLDLKLLREGALRTLSGNNVRSIFIKP